MKWKQKESNQDTVIIYDNNYKKEWDFDFDWLLCLVILIV